MATLNLKAKTREVTGKKVSKLRASGEIPAVLYGNKVKPVNLSLNYLEFEKLFKQAGESSLIDLTIDGGKPAKVLVQDYQLDMIKNRINHVDLHQVRMDEKLHTEIPLKFVNESPAVKAFGGILVTNLHALEAECLPQDLVHEIVVDLAALANLEDSVLVSDLKVPAGIHIHNLPTDVVILVQPPRSESELADLEAKPAEKLPEDVVQAKAAEESAAPEEK